MENVFKHVEVLRYQYTSSNRNAQYAFLYGKATDIPHIKIKWLINNRQSIHVQMFRGNLMHLFHYLKLN
jgi:hypothetical protein